MSWAVVWQFEGIHDEPQTEEFETKEDAEANRQVLEDNARICGVTCIIEPAVGEVEWVDDVDDV
jgi:hypothetical protein